MPTTYIPVSLPAWLPSFGGASWRLVYGAMPTKLRQTEAERMERERTIVSLDLNAGED